MAVDDDDDDDENFIEFLTFGEKEYSCKIWTNQFHKKCQLLTDSLPTALCFLGILLKSINMIQKYTRMLYISETKQEVANQGPMKHCMLQRKSFRSRKTN